MREGLHSVPFELHLDQLKKLVTKLGADGFEANSLRPWALACAVGTLNHTFVGHDEMAGISFPEWLNVFLCSVFTNGPNSHRRPVPGGKPLPVGTP